MYVVRPSLSPKGNERKSQKNLHFVQSQVQLLIKSFSYQQESPILEAARNNSSQNAVSLQEPIKKIKLCDYSRTDSFFI